MGPVELLSDAELKSQFETNLFAAVRMTQAVLPAMIEQRNGTIINISSVLGRLGTPFNGAYVSSKFALEGISESLKIRGGAFRRAGGNGAAGAVPHQFSLTITVRGEAIDDDNAAYAPLIRQYRGNHDIFEHLGGNPVRVAKVVHKIITSPSPNFRYPVGIDARAGMFAARVLPERTLLANTEQGDDAGVEVPTASRTIPDATCYTC